MSRADYVYGNDDDDNNNSDNNDSENDHNNDNSTVADSSLDWRWASELQDGEGTRWGLLFTDLSQPTWDAEVDSSYNNIIYMSSFTSWRYDSSNIAVLAEVCHRTLNLVPPIRALLSNEKLAV